jgi:hypothetical protein
LVLTGGAGAGDLGGPVTEAVAVGVRIEGLGGRRWVVVGDEAEGVGAPEGPVAIGVGEARGETELGAVLDAVAVAVCARRRGVFARVEDAVAAELHVVGDAVVVAVDVEVAGPQEGLVGVEETVAVGVAHGAGGVQGVRRAGVARVALARVDAAVRVGVLGAIGHAVAVGVGAERVGGAVEALVGLEERQVGAAEGPVAVGVDHGQALAALGAVLDAVFVGVGEARVGVDAGVEDVVAADLLAVGEAVVVGVGVEAVGAEGEDLVAIVEAVAIGVDGGADQGLHARVAGVVRVALPGVDDAVAVGVLVAVVEAVVVGVGADGVGGRGPRVAVGDEARRVGAEEGAGAVEVGEADGAAALGAVEEAVVVGVGEGRVGVDPRVVHAVFADLLAVGEAVVVAVAVIG